MKWLHKRFLLLTYVAVLSTFVIIGCTSKEDPAEVLVTCGEHSCGDLTMVTTDTSSNGYHYLNPTMSPDGTRILFTADWRALPSDPKDPGDEYFVNYRQLITMPVQQGVEPTQDLLAQGAQLIRLGEIQIRLSGNLVNLQTILDDPKSDPIWEDDNNVIFSLYIRQVGQRLFRAKLDTPGSQENTVEAEPLWMEPSDAQSSPRVWEHLSPSLSTSGDWLVFTHTGCAIADSFETCSGVSIYAMDMSTATANDGYDAVVVPLTNEYSRIERPRFSPDGTQIVFSAGLDVSGDVGVGTEIYTMDFDAAAVAAGTHDLDDNVERVTYTTVEAGDPIGGILNSDPCFAPGGRHVYFVSTRRAPSTTLHDRNIWRVEADGSQDPEIYFFSRYDDLDPSFLDDGRLLMSSMVGFPTNMLNRLEEESYQNYKQENEAAHAANPDEVPLLNEIDLRSLAKTARDDLMLFGGVMSHIYLYR
ncbi:MAG: hypothetical protein GY838_17745 [bacterium]|nr:hypothetical protein [bacterium]